MGAGVAMADQASAPASPAAGRIAAGMYHTCAVLTDGSVRCWGYGADGALGYGNTRDVGVSQTPASVGAVNLGAGRLAVAIAAGSFHTCAILDDGSVRCWGYGANGRLGYGRTSSVGASQLPGSVGPVDLGPGRTARAITAGGAHTCAILDDGSLRCWGFGYQGQLGYGNTRTVGATLATTPARVGPVDLGAGRTAAAIAAGTYHTCAILDDGSVRCWGYGAFGQLGYGNTNNRGDTPTTIPARVGPVYLGPGRSAKAISAGGAHTCAILDDGSVRCWGNNLYGQLGYGNTNSVGDRKTPGSVAPVDLGPGRSAVAISVASSHSCAILDDGGVRCWGYGADGVLGYGSTRDLAGTPATVPARMGGVKLGAGRTAVAIGTGDSHTCVLLDDATVRCWGYGADGELGYCSTRDVGNTPANLPGEVGPVNLEIGDSGVRCASPAAQPDPLRVQALRARALHRCLAGARRPAHRARRGRRACLRRYGRTPGRVRTLRARAVSRTEILLSFAAPGSDANRPPAARAYLVKQSRHPIRGARELRQARALCHGSCRFNVTAIGTKIKLTITHLAARTSYYYTVAARDNVSGRLGPGTPTGRVRTP